MSDRVFLRALGILGRLHRQRLDRQLDTRTRLKKQIPHDLNNLLATLPEGRRRVAEGHCQLNPRRSIPVLGSGESMPF